MTKYSYSVKEVESSRKGLSRKGASRILPEKIRGAKREEYPPSLP